MEFYLIIKKIVDFLISLIALIILSPVFLIIGIAIKVDSPGPIFFKQRRIGKHKKEFEILKFRTMRTDTPKDLPTHLFKNPESYITKTGKILRSTSLDELPQLINIIKGEMAIIGPRPALWNQFDLIEERDKYSANDITPGLTGWAQINGRDTISIEDKARYDGDYVKKVGIKIDLNVFIKTLVFVSNRIDIVEGGTSKLEKQKDDTKISLEEVAVTDESLQTTNSLNK